MVKAYRHFLTSKAPGAHSAHKASAAPPNIPGETGRILHTAVHSSGARTLQFCSLPGPETLRGFRILPLNTTRQE